MLLRIQLENGGNAVLLTLSYQIIGRAKRAPHWGVQSRFHVIYICTYVGMSRMSN